ncbi:MAG TPA: plastocyanin/azurin family copper-binding protein [Vicinamibacterales bacterium]
MTKIPALFSLFILAAAAACSPPASNEAPAATSGQAQAAAEPAASSAPAVHDGRAIEITGNDTMKFSVTEIRAKAGERLSVTLRNVGTMPKFSMGHNWVLLAGGVDPEAFVVAAAEAPTTEYVPASKKSEILAATKLLGPKESDTVTFNAPSTPGKYDYLCSFPGHFQVGMRGVLIVE